MPVLKSLSFTALPKPATDPVHIRRAKLIGRLEEQKALLDDPNLIRTIQRNGQRGRREADRDQTAEGPALVAN